MFILRFSSNEEIFLPEEIQKEIPFLIDAERDVPIPVPFVFREFYFDEKKLTLFSECISNDNISLILSECEEYVSFLDFMGSEERILDIWKKVCEIFSPLSFESLVFDEVRDYYSYCESGRDIFEKENGYVIPFTGNVIFPLPSYDQREYFSLEIKFENKAIYPLLKVIRDLVSFFSRELYKCEIAKKNKAYQHYAETGQILRYTSGDLWGFMRRNEYNISFFKKISKECFDFRVNPFVDICSDVLAGLINVNRFLDVVCVLFFIIDFYKEKANDLVFDILLSLGKVPLISFGGYESITPLEVILFHYEYMRSDEDSEFLSISKTFNRVFEIKGLKLLRLLENKIPPPMN